MKPSTKAMLRKHGWRIDRFVHNYFYFVFYYPYVRIMYAVVGQLRHLSWLKILIPIGKSIFNRYHAKVLSLSDTRRILSLNEDIIVFSERNKQIIPFKYAYKIILQGADHLAVMDCPCKKSTKAPFQYLHSCIAVGRDLSSFWLEHCEKYNARRISQQEALRLVEVLRKAGHITQAFFKVATGGSTGVICHCHPDTCVSLQATYYSKRLHPDLTMTTESGYSVRRREALCEHCQTCLTTCYFDGIRVEDGQWIYRVRACLGCGRCVDSCPTGALSLYNDTRKTQPLDINMVRARTSVAPPHGRKVHGDTV